jgi:hypothetical protein
MKGLAEAGMPMGSPGMEVAGMTETDEVVLFGPAGRKMYGRYEGAMVRRSNTANERLMQAQAVVGQGHGQRATLRT